MKKFYALALAAFALTASAEGIQGGFNLNPIKARSTSMVRPEAHAYKAPAKAAAASIDEISGIYTWEALEMLTDADGNELGEQIYGIKIVAGEDNNVEIQMDYGTFEGTFDPETGNISMPSGQLVDVDIDGYKMQAYFTHVVWPDGGEPENSEEPLILTAVKDGFETGADDFISVLAVENGQGAGYFHFAMNNLFTKYVEDAPEGWTLIGTFKYQDYYILGAYNINPADYAYEVAVAQKDDNDKVIRILNPYTSPMFPLLSYNDNPADGYIEIDMTNPDFITVCSPDGAGYGSNQAEFDNIYPMNLEYYFKIAYPTADEETIIEQIETSSDPTTFVDDVLTISDAVFGVSGDEHASYTWNGRNPNIAILWLGESTSGINNVVADNENNINAPVVYYNLQGVQVANPQGGIFIRKQGNQTSKVILK